MLSGWQFVSWEIMANVLRVKEARKEMERWRNRETGSQRANRKYTDHNTARNSQQEARKKNWVGLTGPNDCQIRGVIPGFYTGAAWLSSKV